MGDVSLKGIVSAKGNATVGKQRMQYSPENVAWHVMGIPEKYRAKTELMPIHIGVANYVRATTELINRVVVANCDLQRQLAEARQQHARPADGS